MSLWYKLNDDHSYEECDFMEAKVPHHLWQTRTQGYLVSTIFLSLDHRYSPDGDPVLFETMIFHEDTGFDTGFDERYAKRYTTYDDAEEGHQKALFIVNEAVGRGMTVEDVANELEDCEVE